MDGGLSGPSSGLDQLEQLYLSPALNPRGLSSSSSGPYRTEGGVMNDSLLFTTTQPPPTDQHRSTLSGMGYEYDPSSALSSFPPPSTQINATSSSPSSLPIPIPLTNPTISGEDYRSPFGSPFSHYTPSYAGSWTSSHSRGGSISEASFTGSPQPPPAELAFPSINRNDPYLNSSRPKAPHRTTVGFFNNPELFNEFRGMSFDEAPTGSGSKEESLGGLGGLGDVDVNQRLRDWSGDVAMSSATIGGGEEEEFKSRPRQSWMDKDMTLQPSSSSSSRKQRGSSAGPMLGGSGSMFPGAKIFDSPPTTHSELPTQPPPLSLSPPTTTSTTSNPLRANYGENQKTLAPLEIPTGLNGPSLNLIQPTPNTARPRQKGKGTLELERALGELVDRDEQQIPFQFQPTQSDISSQYPFHLRSTLSQQQQPHSQQPLQQIPFYPTSNLAFPQQQPHPLPQLLPFHLYGYAYPSLVPPPPSIPNNQLLQPHLSPSLPSRKTPVRQRSKSETDIQMFDTSTLSSSSSSALQPPPNALLTDQYGQTWNPTSTSTSTSISNPTSTHPSPSLPHSKPPSIHSHHSNSGRASPALSHHSTQSHSHRRSPSAVSDSSFLGDDEQKPSTSGRRRSELPPTGRKAGVGGPGYQSGIPNPTQTSTTTVIGGTSSSGVAGIVRRARSIGGKSNGSDKSTSENPNPQPNSNSSLNYGVGVGPEGIAARYAAWASGAPSQALGFAPPLPGPGGQLQGFAPPPPHPHMLGIPFYGPVGVSMGMAPPPPPPPAHQPNAGMSFALPPVSGGGVGASGRTPYVYHHSPAGSVSSRQGSEEDRGEEEEGDGEEEEGKVSVESKTTAATIEAAMRRRKPTTTARFVCDLCGETFTRRYNLRGHQRAHRNEKPYQCSYEGCEKAFARAHDCKRHELLHLGVRKYHCEPCSRDFVRLDALQRHHRSEVGQVCVQQLKESGYVFGYDCSITPGGVAL